MSEASPTVAMSIATEHTDIPVCSSTVMLTYTSVFNPLLGTLAPTHVHQFNCPLLLHFHSQFPKIYTFQSWYFPFSEPLLPSSRVILLLHVLQHKSTVISIICFRASDYHDSHGIWPCQWQLLHRLLYQNRHNQLNAEPHWPIPWKTHQF